ncbi:mCG147326 [Mus musculus]|nr:mCG147326 [Mus musculus]
MQRPWRDGLYWLVSPGLLSLLSYRTQDYQPRDGTTYNGPSPLDHQLRKCPTAGSHGGTSPTEAPFSVMITPACVKLAHKTSQDK